MAALSLGEREEISRALVAGESVRSIAARLGRAPSTVSRELKRNGGQESYRATQADSAAWDRAIRPRRCKLAKTRSLARVVAEKLRLLWSPEQIAGWLKHTYPCAESHYVAHETIYRSLFGSSSSQIATLVERQTRYVMLVKLDGTDSPPVVKALIKNARKLPQELYKSLTWDRGTEMHGHKRFTVATDIQVYFCDPQSPWQRGSNENTNGLLRQYMPKGIDISGYSQLQLNAIARQLNQRPRKTLGFHTPVEIFIDRVALTS